MGYRCFKGCKNLVDVFIPTTVTTISDEAFWSCGITNLDYLPSSIESIGSRAFRACYYINNLRLPDSIKHLYNGAFEFCGFVNEIHIPGSIESIGDGALNCSWQGTDTYVTDIYYYSQDPIVCDDPFFYKIYESATLHYLDGYINKYETVEPWCRFLKKAAGNQSGIEDIPDADNLNTIIYNLNGIQIDPNLNMKPGIYIRKTSKSTEKIIIK